MAVLLVLALIYLPPMARLFGLLPLPMPYWAGLLTFPVVLYSLDRVRKSFARRLDEVRKV
jgi:hypothetical protein